MTAKNQDELLERLRAVFQTEAQEHCRTISACLLELEGETLPEKRANLLETVYRATHSLKGAARTVNMEAVSRLCQSLETVFSECKKGNIAPAPELFDVLHRAADLIPELVESPETVSPEKIAAILENLSKIATDEETGDETGTSSEEDHNVGRGLPRQTGGRDLPELAGLAPPYGRTGTTEAHSDPPRPESTQSPDRETPPPLEVRSSPQTLRIPVERLDSLLRQAEEMLSAKLSARQHAADLSQAMEDFAAWEKEWQKTRSLALREGRTPAKGNGGGNSGDATAEPVAQLLERNQAFVDSLREQLSSLALSAEVGARLLDRMVDDLLESAKHVLMQPFSSLFSALQKIVRGVSRDMGKEADLVFEGEEVEVDKRILDEMKDPLMHLLRNAVDHGIEKPEARETRGKPRRGRIALAISQVEGNKVEVVLRDDGAGIDAEKLKAAAVQKGILSEQDARRLDDSEILSMVYQSGVSTSPLLTDVSGRGLGLAIVREKVEELGGTVSIETRPGEGTAFRMLLPLTLAAFKGVLVQVGDQKFILPSAAVDRVLRMPAESIETVENRETISFGGRAISLVWLADVLELPRAREAGQTPGPATIVVVSALGKQIAFAVDKILSEQQVLNKPLGRQLSRVRNVAGASVLGTGEIAMILNARDLIKSAASAFGGVGPVGPVGQIGLTEEKRKSRSILVVEDSITSRMLLKNILEGAGHRVATAVDGVDAMTALKTGDFDLVVSDIQMPRMDGFDLTARIRRDKKLSNLPVVLVTALDSREDKERGIEAGANAYIRKSSFEQSNLLETVERLI